MMIHSKFVSIVEEYLKMQGYKIIDREVTIEDIVINGKKIRVDLLIEKDGKVIPVECGRIQPPRHERIEKLKEKFGVVYHIPYGHSRKVLKRRLKSFMGLNSLFIKNIVFDSIRIRKI